VGLDGLSQRPRGKSATRVEDLRQLGQSLKTGRPQVRGLEALDRER
jgi:hypothetical protein